MTIWKYLISTYIYRYLALFMIAPPASILEGLIVLTSLYIQSFYRVWNKKKFCFFVCFKKSCDVNSHLQCFGVWQIRVLKSTWHGACICSKKNQKLRQKFNFWTRICKKKTSFFFFCFMQYVLWHFLQQFVHKSF